MFNFLLDCIGQEKVTAWLMDKVQFAELDNQDNKILHDVFFRVPEFKKWLKQMQVRLLRNTLVDKAQAPQREGQILFIELLLANDIPSGNFIPEKVAPKEIELPTKEEVLRKWNKEPQDDAANKKGEEDNGSHEKPVRGKKG